MRSSLLRLFYREGMAITRVKAQPKTRRRLLISLILLAFLLWCAWDTSNLMVTRYTIASPRLPQGFDGFTIAQVSDLHNAAFGRENERLLALLQQAEPDIIALTGDLVDSRHTDIEAALAFVRQAAAIAPLYYVIGNHEARLAEYPAFEKELKALHVTVLHNQSALLDRDGQRLRVAGMDDPGLQGSRLTREEEAQVAEGYLSAIGRSGDFTLLLSHRPKFLPLYAQYGMDAVLTGHTHGGQFRLPSLGAFFLPGQGFFPRLDAGLFEEEGTQMVISRGLGNSIIPLRILNRPELVVVDLKTSPGGD